MIIVVPHAHAATCSSEASIAVSCDGGGESGGGARKLRECEKVGNDLFIDASKSRLVGYLKSYGWEDAKHKFHAPEDYKAGDEDNFVKVSCAVGGKAGHHVWVVKGIASAKEIAWSIWMSMDPESPVIGRTPLNKAAPLVVGQPMWLWAEDVSNPKMWGPWSKSKSGVTLTAKVTYVKFDFGDGGSVKCTMAHLDRKWSRFDAFAEQDSPECGYRMTVSKKKVSIKATAHWEAKWSGYGESGTITHDEWRTTYVDVAEIQTVR
ncbi:MAG: hypothetical protein LBI99_08710 [Propionibacteriaceae bacterium]|jgi:hypothetical protein|nr:hypothetical protein [Propionibacteriaceae bacterium]